MRPRTRIVAVIAVALAYGIGIELRQGVVPYRYYSPADLVANALGVGLASTWFALETRIQYRSVPSGD